MRNKNQVEKQLWNDFQAMKFDVREGDQGQKYLIFDRDDIELFINFWCDTGSEVRMKAYNFIEKHVDENNESLALYKLINELNDNSQNNCVVTVDEDGEIVIEGVIYFHDNQQHCHDQTMLLMKQIADLIGECYNNDMEKLL